MVKTQYKDEKKFYLSIYTVFILIHGREVIREMQFTALRSECGLCSSSILMYTWEVFSSENSQDQYNTFQIRKIKAQGPQIHCKKYLYDFAVIQNIWITVVRWTERGKNTIWKAKNNTLTTYQGFISFSFTLTMRKRLPFETGHSMRTPRRDLKLTRWGTRSKNLVIEILKLAMGSCIIRVLGMNFVLWSRT